MPVVASCCFLVLNLVLHLNFLSSCSAFCLGFSHSHSLSLSCSARVKFRLWKRLSFQLLLPFRYPPSPAPFPPPTCLSVSLSRSFVSFLGHIAWFLWVNYCYQASPVGPILERMQLCRVHSQRAALCKSFVTVRTGVRLFAGVCAYVFREIVLHTEGLLTVSTMKRFFTCKNWKKTRERPKPMWPD